MKTLKAITTSVLLISSLAISSLASASSLSSRLGGLAYYDDVADLTWLADANAAVGSVYDTYSPGSGSMNWADANAWAAGLNVAGVTGWRLPDTIDTGSSGCDWSTTGGTDCGYNVDTTTGEMANMYYNVLGNLAYYDTNGNVLQPGWGLQNTGPFSNIQSGYYWSATEYAPNTGNAWLFNMYDGRQRDGNKGYSLYAWAVQSGDVSAVPVPAAMWLFGSGLLGLIGVARRK